MKVRNPCISIAKGILMLTVVIGHIENINELKLYIYWFHMPCFFMISGYLYKFPAANILTWIKKTILRYMIPYAAYFILLSLFFYKDMSLKNILRMIYGGRVLHGVWWFPTCLFFTLLVFTLLQYFVKNKYLKIGIVFFCGILACLESNYYIPAELDHLTRLHRFPWNLDVVLMALVYLSIGYYTKIYINKVLTTNNIKKQMSVILVATIFITGFVFLSVKNIYTFRLDMKYSDYNNFFLSLLIPIICCYLVLVVSKTVNKIKYLKSIFVYIGDHTMPIMYLHLEIIYFLSEINYLNHWIILTVLSIILCLGFDYIINLNRLSNAFFKTGSFNIKK